jgi:hypothetical protein
MQLTTVRLPATITKIGSQAFYCCTNLTEFSLNVRGSLTIGSSAFYDCDKISSVNISAQRGLTLEDNAFGACNEITDITLSAKDDVVLGSSSGSPFTSCDKIETFTGILIEEVSIVIDKITKVETPQSAEKKNRPPLTKISLARNHE